MIPFLDVSKSYSELQYELNEAVGRVLRSGTYIGGDEVELFENEFATFVGAAHGVGVGNGLDALFLALIALGIGPGDEVVVPSNTFIATWFAVSQTGAVPVPVEPDPHTYTIDVASIEKAVTSKTKAIIPVHLYGMPADLDPILKFGRKNQIVILEDAAQAHGAFYLNRRIGSHSSAVAWSFYPGKNLGAFGDGGMITTNDSDLAAKIRSLSNYGTASLKNVHEMRGFNSRLDPMQAAILRVKLPYLDTWNHRRSEVAMRYQKELAHLTEISLPKVPSYARTSWHLFVIESDDRDLLQNFLSRAGIQTQIHYPIPPHSQQAYSSLNFDGLSLDFTERLSGKILSLPIGPHMSTKDVTKVIDTMHSYKEQLPQSEVY